MLPYLLGGAVLLVMLFVAGFDEGRRQVARDHERRRLKWSITDLECWLEREDRKTASQLEREARLRGEEGEFIKAATEYEVAQEQVRFSPVEITDEPGQIIRLRTDHELQRRAYTLGDD